MAGSEGEALGLEGDAEAEGSDMLPSEAVAHGNAADADDPPAGPLGQEDMSAAEAFKVTGPSPMGYVCQDGKTVMRIQRGNPKGSLSVRCYQHSKCSFLLSLKDAPSDDDLIRWCFAVSAKESAASTAEAAKLAQDHLKLVEKWRPDKKTAAAKRSSGAASSKG